MYIGKTEDREKKITTGLKRHWRLIPKELTVPIQLPKPKDTKTSENAEADTKTTDEAVALQTNQAPVQESRVAQ